MALSWSNSKIYSAFVTDAINNTASHSPALLADTINVALYNGGGATATDQTVADTASGYGVGVWAGNEITATGWTAGGLALASKTSTFASNVYTFDAADKAGGATDTVTNAYGVLVFDNTLATKDGICYNYFGGAASVTSGTFTVVWNGSGIFTLTL